MTRYRRSYGAAAERLAVAWYTKRDFVVLDTNWRVREGELDIVLWRDRLLVICEVKARRTDAYGSPAAAVDWRKQRKIRELTRLYLASWPHGPRPEVVRFDVAAVTGIRVEIIESAF